MLRIFLTAPPRLSIYVLLAHLFVTMFAVSNIMATAIHCRSQYMYSGDVTCY